MSSPASPELVEERLRGLHHEVPVQDELGYRPQRGDHHRAERDRRDEMTIHDVDMNNLGMLLDQLDLRPEPGEIGRQDRGAIGVPRSYPTGAAPPAREEPADQERRKAATNIPSDPSRCGQSRSRSTAGRPATVTGSAARSGRRRRIASHAASVSARVKVHTA